MDEQMELSDILSDKEPQQVTPAEPVASPVAAPVEAEPTPPAAPEKPETEAEAQARGRDASGKFVAKEKPPVTPVVEPATPAAPAAPATPAAAPQMSDKEKAYLAAAIDERNKRQVLERQLAEATKSAKPAEPPKPFWDDPEGTLTAFKQEMNNVVLTTRLQTAEMIARSKHPDFDENVKIFAELVQQTPGLWQQAILSADPAEFAFTTGKNHKALKDAGSIDELRAKIEKETRIKIEEEFKKKQEDAIKERSSIPPSLSDAHGVSMNRPVWNGPPSLDDILKT